MQRSRVRLIPCMHLLSNADSRGAFIALYGLSFFFSNAGPNPTTFIYPSEVFPTKLRSTLHGMSAASGKLGAIVGTYGIAYLSRESIRAVFLVCGGPTHSLWHSFVRLQLASRDRCAGRTVDVNHAGDEWEDAGGGHRSATEPSLCSRWLSAELANAP